MGARAVASRSASGPPMDSGSLGLGYLLPAFPVVSESFVAGEVTRLATRGVRPRSIVLDRSYKSDHKMAADLRTLGIDPAYMLDSFPLRLGSRAARFSFAHPIQAARAVRLDFGNEVPKGVSRFARILKVLASCDEISSNGLRHVHGHWGLPTDVAMAAAEATGITFSFSAHAVDIYDEPREQVARRLRYSKFVSTCTAQNARYLSELGGESKVHLVYHGVDLSFFDGVRLPAASKPRILSVGRLLPKKGFLTLIAVVAELRARGRDLECVIVGEGPQRAELEQAVRAYGLEATVRLAGSESHAAVRERLRSTDIFVLCPIAEAGHYGIPNVLFESMAMRVATVSQRMPAIGELIDTGHNGLVFDTTGELLECLSRLLDNYELRTTVGDAGRRTVEETFDAEVTIEAMVTLLTHQSDGNP